MINDIQMLDCLSETADMGRDSMKQVIEKAESSELKTALESQFREYDKMYCEADNLLKNYGEEPKKANPMAKMNAHVMTNLKAITAENSTSKIAEMVIQGSTMGITNVTKKLHEYNGSSQEIKSLAEKQIKTDQRNIDEMKKFL